MNILSPFLFIVLMTNHRYKPDRLAEAQEIRLPESAAVLGFVVRRCFYCLKPGLSGSGEEGAAYYARPRLNNRTGISILSGCFLSDHQVIVIFPVPKYPCGYFCGIALIALKLR